MAELHPVFWTICVKKKGGSSYNLAFLLLLIFCKNCITNCNNFRHAYICFSNSLGAFFWCTKYGPNCKGCGFNKIWESQVLYYWWLKTRNDWFVDIRIADRFNVGMSKFDASSLLLINNLPKDFNDDSRKISKIYFYCVYVSLIINSWSGLIHLTKKQFLKKIIKNF